MIPCEAIKGGHTEIGTQKQGVGHEGTVLGAKHRYLPADELRNAEHLFPKSAGQGKSSTSKSRNWRPNPSLLSMRSISIDLAPLGCPVSLLYQLKGM